MAKFTFKTIVPFAGVELLTDCFYLWVLHADKIPPHIGCSLDSKFFSLKINGKDHGLPVDSLLEIITKKKVSTILIQLNSVIDSEELHRVFSQFTAIFPGKNTCLSPITSLLDCSETVFKLSDLLNYLDDQSAMKNVFGLNLGNDYTGIPEYDQEDITNRLYDLNRAKSER